MSRARRILLTTFGSLGDLNPFLALAIELKRRGYEALVGSIDLHRPFVEKAGIEFRHVRTGVWENPDPNLIARLFHPRKGPKTLIADMVMPALRTAYEDTLTAAEGVELLVAHPLTFATRTVARVLGLQWVSVQLAPFAYLSVFDPPVLPAAGPLSKLTALGPRFSRAIFELGKAIVRSWSKPYVRFNAEFGLASARDPMFDEHGPQLELALFSELLGAKQSDWPPQAVATGFAFYDGGHGAALSPDIDRFLSAGEPPIVFTLGSSAVFDPGRFYAESAHAAALLGCRAMLLTGREVANRPKSLPSGVAAFDFAPYSLVFARAAAIVHQGGVGTTAQAMRAGKPMLVMPYGFDQQDNAARVARLGMARVIARSRYSAKRVARQLEYLLRDGATTLRAAEVGRRVAAEDGAVLACDLLETLLHGRESVKEPT